MGNKKKNWRVKNGNGDYDFGVRPTKHTARVLSCQIGFVQLKTYLADSCESRCTEVIMSIHNVKL